MDFQQDFDTARELFKSRIRTKQISQISYELKEIDRAFPVDYYGVESSETMLDLYSVIEEKIIALAEDIKANNLYIKNKNNEI